ncbi:MULTISPECIES: hypothetical protein [unclassified Anabaena]|uniref:hypothetical protein n=1 Tax=unclassified Anabaena TaxID=2619674 RepID=UPI0039C71031
MKIIFLILAFLITSILGCNNQAVNELPQKNISETTTRAVAVTNSTEKIKFKTEFGADLFSLKQQANGAKLVDGNDQELANMRAEELGKLKIKNASDKVLGYVIRERGQWTIKNPEQTQSLYILKRHNDLNYSLEDTAKKEIYQIKTQNDRWEINTPQQNLVYQIRIKDGKTSLRNASANTVFSTKSQIAPIAFACFGLDILTHEQQAALAYAVNLTGGQ